MKHAINLGKGRAMKTGINGICLCWPDATAVVTADADGQHRAGDIMRIARLMHDEPRSIILGSRTFDGSVPWKSLVGNRVTGILFRLLTGVAVADTQTGLRGLPLDLAGSLLQIAGERYEYELNVLLAVKGFRRAVREVPIATVYQDGNRGSHFNPILDSMAVYAVLLRFAGSSLLSSGIDYLLFMAAFSQTGSITSGIVAGRTVSSLVNAMLNREFVFKARSGIRVLATQLLRYYALVVTSAVLSYLLIKAGTERLHLPISLAKITAETLLFGVNFIVQREFVFRGNADRAAASERPDGVTLVR
jgi:putative flippase GtrA